MWTVLKIGPSEAAGKAARISRFEGQLEAQLSCKLLLFLRISPRYGLLHPSHHIYLALLVFD